MQFKFRNAIFGMIIYAYLMFILFSIGSVAMLLGLVYVAACMLANNRFIAEAESRRDGKTIEFSQTGAANALGQEWGSFHHVFYSKERVVEAFHSALNEALSGRLACKALQEIAFKDVDRDLQAPETRNFLCASAAETSRKTGFYLLFTYSRIGNVQGVRWWILLSGLRDPNKVFWRYVFSPATVPFILLPYIWRQYDPLSGLTTVYPGFFNGIDVMNRARELQFVAFETLVEVLESFGIDTSDLKLQKSNILNINVSGGKTSFGSVVQGAMNKVQGNVVGAKA